MRVRAARERAGSLGVTLRLRGGSGRTKLPLYVDGGRTKLETYEELWLHYLNVLRTGNVESFNVPLLDKDCQDVQWDMALFDLVELPLLGESGEELATVEAVAEYFMADTRGGYVYNADHDAIVAATYVRWMLHALGPEGNRPRGEVLHFSHGSFTIDEILAAAGDPDAIAARATDRATDRATAAPRAAMPPPPPPPPPPSRPSSLPSPQRPPPGMPPFLPPRGMQPGVAPPPGAAAEVSDRRWTYWEPTAPTVAVAVAAAASPTAVATPAKPPAVAVAAKPPAAAAAAAKPPAAAASASTTGGGATGIAATHQAKRPRSAQVLAARKTRQDAHKARMAAQQRRDADIEPTQSQSPTAPAQTASPSTPPTARPAQPPVEAPAEAPAPMRTPRPTSVELHLQAQLRAKEQLITQIRSAKQRDLKVAFKRGVQQQKKTATESKRMKKKKGKQQQKREEGAARREHARAKKRKGAPAPEALHSGDRKHQRRFEAHESRQQQPRPWQQGSSSGGGSNSGGGGSSSSGWGSGSGSGGSSSSSRPWQQQRGAGWVSGWGPSKTLETQRQVEQHHRQYRR